MQDSYQNGQDRAHVYFAFFHLLLVVLYTQ